MQSYHVIPQLNILTSDVRQEVEQFIIIPTKSLSYRTWPFWRRNLWLIIDYFNFVILPKSFSIFKQNILLVLVHSRLPYIEAGRDMPSSSSAILVFYRYWEPLVGPLLLPHPASMKRARKDVRAASPNTLMHFAEASWLQTSFKKVNLRP